MLEDFPGSWDSIEMKMEFEIKNLVSENKNSRQNYI
jgi:hypothetical protein